MKFLLWLAIIAILVMWLMRGKKSSANHASANHARRPSTGAPKSAEAMLQCAHCGIHFPASEAVRDSAGTVFCSDAHRLQHAPD